MDEPKVPEGEVFHKYYRLDGTLARNQPLIVNFDIGYHQWRVFLVTHTPGSVTWTETRNGTWESDGGSPHIAFPSLNLMAPNLTLFTRHCQYQPFTTVFRTDGMSDMQIYEQNQKEWSSSSSSAANIVMRTASFGHGPGKLEVCARRRGYAVKDGEGKVSRMEGLGDDVVMPLGLMAVLRKQMENKRRYAKKCSWR